MGNYKDETANELVAAICRDATAGMKLSIPCLGLVDLCKRIDLRGAEYADVVKRISQLVYRDDDDVRQDAVFALCNFNPVDGFEWVAIEAWKHTSASSANWIASGITSSFSTPKMITPQLVAIIASRAFEEFTMRDSFIDHEDEYIYRVDLTTRQCYETAIMQVMNHFLDLFRGKAPSPFERDAFGNSQKVIDWITVAEVFYLSVSNSAAVPPTNRSK